VAISLYFTGLRQVAGAEGFYKDDEGQMIRIGGKEEAGMGCKFWYRKG